MKKLTTYNCIFRGEETTISVGDKYNRLEIIKIYNYESKKHADCLCECGNEVERVLLRHMLSGNTKSCGCYNIDSIIDRSKSRGAARRGKKERLYNTWVEMRRRCNSENNSRYLDYGGRGINICDEWNEYLEFKKWAMCNGYIEGLSLERKDVNKGYNPENCTWIILGDQSKNRRTCNFITYEGQTKTVSDWARELGIHRSTITRRQNKGFTVEEILKR